MADRLVSGVLTVLAIGLLAAAILGLTVYKS